MHAGQVQKVLLADMSTVNKQFGFSLVELMIAIAIFGLVATLAIPSYRQWIENSRIRNAAETIQNGLQKARAQAVSNNAQVRLVLGANSAWTIECVAVTAVCPAVIEDHKASEGASDTITIAALPAGATTLTYTNLGSRSANAGELTAVNIDSSALAASDTRDLRVVIGTGGNVRMCDPNLASTDIRACP